MIIKILSILYFTGGQWRDARVGVMCGWFWLAAWLQRFARVANGAGLLADRRKEHCSSQDVKKLRYALVISRYLGDVRGGGKISSSKNRNSYLLRFRIDSQLTKIY